MIADVTITELYSMNPIQLGQALHCIQYLKDHEWIDITSIDIWLMRVWETLPQPEARYIPSICIPPISRDDDEPAGNEDEIDTFRNLFDDLPERGVACPLETLVYVLNCGANKDQSGNHFCVVVFDPKLRAVYVLGKEIHTTKSNNDSADWKSWNGDKIWKKACQLMGWTDPPPMVLRTVDWRQNGYDCGPIACQTAQHILTRGLKTESSGHWKRPTMMACCHMLRLKMAELVHQIAIEGYRKYDIVRVNCYTALQAKYGTPVVEAMDFAHDDLWEVLEESPVVQLHDVVRNLRLAMQKCQTCHANLEEVSQRRAAREHPIPVRKADIAQAAARHRKEALKGTKSMNDYVSGRLEEVESEDGSSSLPETQDGQDFEDMEDVDGTNADPSPSEARKVLKVDTDKMQARIGRFPRPVKGLALPSRPHLRGLLLPFDRNFDDYEGGPALEELAPVPETHLQLQPSLMYVCRQIMLTPAPYSLFKDYGYRLFPSFAQAFDLGKPILVKDHLCPVGLPDPPKSIRNYIRHDSKGRHGQDVVVDDLLVVGAKQLLKLADEEDDMILLNGRVGNRYVCVDLLRDSVEPDDLEFSCDIDSLIWITQRPKFKGPVGIYSLPIIRDRAPIWKNNHVQIQVLYPQTEEDQEALGGRTEWFTNSHSLSTLPHLQFGVLQGLSVVNILLFFPRMMHKDPHRHFRVNRIPKGIQDFFWDHVLLPALRSVVPSTRSAYLPVDRSHSSFKMGSGKNSSTFSLDPKDLEKLIRRMKRIVIYLITDFDC
jgi:hypothetical protein